MSIHTILSQMEGQVFGHGEEVIEISIYRKDGKILSIPYNQVKTGLETFATRIVEEVNHESNIRRLDEITKILGLFHAILKELYGKELADELMARFNSAYRDIELDSRTKLQMMKGEV